MNTVLAEFLEQVLSAAWRRRVIILIPVASFLLLSTFVTVFWPRTYASTVLLMLQERGDRNPLRQSPSYGLESRLKADEIDALLKSDRVLSGAMMDIYGDSIASSAKSIEATLRDLRSSLALRLVGNDFIEIEMRDNEAKGLGFRLRVVTTRFLENLLSTDEPFRTARQFAMDQRKLDSDRVRKALENLQARIETASSISDADVEAALAVVARAKLAADAAYAELETSARQTLGEKFDGQKIVETIETERKRLTELRPADPQQEAEVQLARHALTPLEALSITYQKAASELVSAQQIVAKLQADHATSQQLLAERTRLDARLKLATAMFEQHKKRATLPAGSAAAPLGLSAPELIRIIDEPKDPLLPINSSLKIILACIGAGLALGLGLATLAEQLDARLYSVREIERLTSAPAVASLPHLDAGALSALQEPPRAALSSASGSHGPAPPVRLVSSKVQGVSSATQGGAAE